VTGGHIVQVLSTADPKLKAEVYAELDVSITYDHEQHLVSVAAGPPGRCATERVGEPSSSVCDWRLQPWGETDEGQSRPAEGRP